MIREDLEALTGKLISGDVTSVVAEILSDSKYKNDLLRYKHFCTDRHLVEKIKGGMEIVNRQQADQFAGKENNNGPSLADWIADKGVTVSF